MIDNILKGIFIFMTLFIVIFGSLINFLEPLLPAFVSQTFRYGKFSYKGNQSKVLPVVEVPKSWFKHFYVFSSIYSVYALILAVNLYIFKAKPHDLWLAYLDLMVGSGRVTTVSPIAVVIALTLLSLQCLRRFYETWCISVFSNSKMNLSHYLVGFAHYLGTITVILAEAQGFDKAIEGGEINVHQLKFAHFMGIALFLYAWYKQYECVIILASLRKNSTGQVVTEEHKLPRGGLFEYLSSPHLTCEVLLYFSLLIILQSSITFPYVFVWVLCNQLETALLNHWWYKDTFKKYPYSRKAFIPFLI